MMKKKKRRRRKRSNLDLKKVYQLKILHQVISKQSN